MIIKKKFNNNAVSALCEGREVVITGKGIGFAKNSGDGIEEEKIEKIFELSDTNSIRFEQVLNNIPIECLRIAEKIYLFASKYLSETLHKQLILDLADHIYFAIERSKTIVMYELFLLYDIKEVYPKEYEVGQRAFNLINQELNVSLPEEEIGYITFHIVNAEVDSHHVAPKLIVEFVSDIVSVFEFYFPSVENFKKSYSYTRFILHLRFLANRALRGDVFEPYSDDFLFEAFKNDEVLIACINQIIAMLNNNFHYQLSEQEQIYLLIHMKRILKENKVL